MQLNEFSKAKKMEQKAFLAITAMLNSFPQQGATDGETLLKTYSAVLRDTGSQAIIEASQRFVTGEVAGQSKTFSPSVAEFYTEVRRIDELLPYRNRPALPSPAKTERQMSASEGQRMRLKVPMWRYAFEHGLINQLAEANRTGMAAMIVLATNWGIPVPEALFAIPDDEAERQWQLARNRAWAEIERNPPPFLRRQRREQAPKAQSKAA